MKTVLLDTGPIVATLDSNDPKHAMARDGFGRVSAKVITTGAVITEAMFFLQDLPGGPESLVDWVERIQAEVVNCFHLDFLREAGALMTKYADIPMDFADSTLVLLASRLGCGDILTLDERGFHAYRYRRNKPFRLVLQG